ncbi:hypothetical protein ISS86_02650 [Candidatus Microgenomates bacterium]|nr:hypothetical protein [Candidatus Microgenomates bacterium]
MTKKKTVISKVSDAEIRRLVVERLRTLPSGKQISIGSQGSFTKDELIKKVKSGDKLGKKMIKVELAFLRALKKGEFFDEQEPSHN